MENPFWDYSLAHYARAEVAECCLAYQNQQGANINLLLFCCWLGSCGIRLEHKKLAEAQEKIENWDLQAVQPLREVHRFMAASSLSAGTIVSKLQQVELMAEQVVQQILYSWWRNQGFTEGFAEGFVVNNVVGAECQVANLNVYLATLDGSNVPSDSPILWPISGSPASD